MKEFGSMQNIFIRIVSMIFQNRIEFMYNIARTEKHSSNVTAIVNSVKLWNERKTWQEGK